MQTKVLKLESHFDDFQKLEDLLNEGWKIDRADVVSGNNFSKYTSHTYVIYILVK